MDREGGAASRGEGSVGDVVGFGFGDDARGEAGGAGGLEDEGGEVEVVVRDGDGVRDGQGAGG